MTYSDERQDRKLLREIARRAMVERGLEPDFSAGALAQVEGIAGPARRDGGRVRDLRERLWCSIDNDDSRDLDQLTAAEALPGGSVKVLVAIADVDALVGLGSAVDEHARQNTTSVYTVAETFPMLPERLSTDLTSLNDGEDRLAVVVEMTIGEDGVLVGSEVYEALVHNHAKLTYHGVGAWLEGNGPVTEK
ncbi:MAG: RNB domain-containing ribonuclease, partial [FCB group bacterium]|nr:RNB domain-containing ribonuclease [FCB group bacterium]